MSFLTELRNQRPASMPIRGRSVYLPIFFPSISSIKTGLSPLTYFRILKALGATQLLVSAFDIARSPDKNDFIDRLRESKSETPFILMDSGNYEAYWLRDTEWSLDAFNELVSQDICDLAFSFDDQYPGDNVADNVNAILSSVQKSQSAGAATTIIPIIHSRPDLLLETIAAVRGESGLTFLAVPERILGDGVVKRVDTVTKIRKELFKFPDYTYLHLLGTGNPLSLLLFSLAGADTFDGLEWCQTVVQSDSATLHHFQQRELVVDDCRFCRDSAVDYTLDTLGHNVSFYKGWMGEIQKAVAGDDDVLRGQPLIGKDMFLKLNELWD
jgi:hypothetical protein